jgi:hyperosmotically inducible periplasmic protein
MVGLHITTRTDQTHSQPHRRFIMIVRTALTAASAALFLLTAPGCAVTRGQETAGAYVDDSAITTAVKASFVENTMVDAAAISVETLNGTVMLSGFAKNPTEKSTAETLAWKVKGVKVVKNEIAVRP